MRSKSLAGHEVGLARLSAKLIAFWELVLGVRVCHPFHFPMLILLETAHSMRVAIPTFLAFRYAKIRTAMAIPNRPHGYEFYTP
jgi:hypothetical protein